MKQEGNNGIRILVVDDEASVCKAIKMLLEFDGHKVETADGAEAALMIFAKGKYDLIITDYSMGEIKGDRLAAQLKKIDPVQPIILATAFADDFLDAFGPTVPVNAVINKPFSLLELRATIARVMEPGAK